MGENEGLEKDESGLLNFGDYHDWAYGSILREKPHYASYICNGSMRSIPEQQQFQEWATLKEYEVGDQSRGWRKQ